MSYFRSPIGLFVLFFIVFSTACQESSSPPERQTTTPKAEPIVDHRQQVRGLADEIWADTLERSTYLRLQEGLPITFFEVPTLERHRENLKNNLRWRERLEAIDATALEGDELITYEILAFQLANDGTNDDDYWLQFDITPYVSPYLVRFSEQALAGHQFKDKAAADHYLKLVGDYAAIVEHLSQKVEGQIERGIYLPVPALASTRATWEGIMATAPAALSVAEARMGNLSEEERGAFQPALEALITERIVPGYGRLLEVIGDEYEQAAPAAVGLAQYEGGKDVYLRRVRRETTLELTPEEIHERGKQAVADIAARMEAIRNELGYKGTAKEFLAAIKTDERFLADSPEEVDQIFMDYIARIEPKLDGWFRSQPKAAYGVRRLPLAAEAGMTYGYYNPPTAADPVGYYNYNASDLDTRSMIWAGSLIYHELLPGHHFHLATQAENQSLQDLRKKYSVAAYTEGWAEYAASLGIEMGMYETPEELYGRYIGEMFLASRLVVDTGMNYLGWSLQQARDFMADYVVQSESEIASETLRYSTSIPAQALAYRLGYEKMWELRRKAEEALGDAFDIRDFHEVVLSDGTKPLVVLEAKVQRFIKRQLAGEAPQTTAAASKMVLPEPTGPFKVGVGEFSFTDHSREEGYKPGTKRRLHARIYYPADRVSGNPRLRHTDKEHQLFVENFIMPAPPEHSAATRGVLSHSYPEAEVSSAHESFPLLVFSHGGWAYLGTNMAQMEHLASHGYIVVSVTHPYVSAAVLYDDGEVVTVKQDHLQKFMAVTPTIEYLNRYISPDLSTRLQGAVDHNTNENGVMPIAPDFLVWRDDMIAAADAIANGDVPDQVKAVAEKADLDRLGYFGMSFGSAGVAAAHKDPRALAAINLDGGNWDPALHDAEVRVPTLVFHHDFSRAIEAFPEEMRKNLPDAQFFPHSEFTYEKLETMGTREDVVRLMVREATHTDFTDGSLMPDQFRPNAIDGATIQNIMNDYCLAFFDRYVRGEEDAWPAELAQKYDVVEPVDLAYVREWAQASR